MSIGFNAMGAAFFDGDRPIGQEVSLHIAAGMLQIGLDDGRILRWPVEDVRLLPDFAGVSGMMLRLKGDPLTRLFVQDKTLLVHLPYLTKSAPARGRGRLAVWALAAVAGVALQIAVLIPLLADGLAGFIPPKGERALGEATLGHIRNALDESGLDPLKVCEQPAGQGALQRLVQRLDGGETELTVAVLDHPMINAFALPGGYVVLFRGLINAAEGPDEVAAVLAHELGHVISRDPTRHALRSAGSIGVLGLLFGDFAGGAAVLFLTEHLISAQYSQTAETEADRFAYTMLADAGITPAALADMFERLRSEYGDSSGLTAHFLSHPALSERIVAARNAVEDGNDFVPSMSSDDWAALRAICD